MAAVALSARAVSAQEAEAPTGVARVVPPSPAPAGFIHDGPRVLTAEAKQVLNARITAVQARTGGDIGVAIVTDLRGYAPVDAGVAIYRAWKIGKVDSLGSARRDLGALLLIVPKELAPNGRGECWIATGLGAEGTLIDAHAGAICRDRVIPALRVRDYAAAVDSGIVGIAAAFDRAVADENGARANGPAEAGGDASGAAALLRDSTPQEKDEISLGLARRPGSRRHRCSGWIRRLEALPAPEAAPLSRGARPDDPPRRGGGRRRTLTGAAGRGARRERGLRRVGVCVVPGAARHRVLALVELPRLPEVPGANALEHHQDGDGRHAVQHRPRGDDARLCALWVP